MRKSTGRYLIEVFDGKNVIIRRFHDDYEDALDDVYAIEQCYGAECQIEFTDLIAGKRTR